MEQTLGGMYILVVLFLIVLAILWFILPFAIFGTKGKLDELIRETRRTNSQLEKLLNRFPVTTRSDSTVSIEEPPVLELSHDQIMSKYGLSHDGEKYIFEGHRYDRIEDAVAYAKSQTAD